MFAAQAVRRPGARAGLVLAAVLAAVLFAGCSGGGSGGYDGDFEAGFRETCEAATGDPEVCGCTYERLQQSVPFEQAEQLDQQLREDPDAPLPEDVAELIAGCVAGAVPPSITTTSSSTSSTMPPTPGEDGQTPPAEADGTTTSAAEAG